MDRILIPSMMEALLHDVELCLELAKEQGFSVDKFELGVGPTHSVQITQAGNTTELVTDLIDSNRICEADFYITYHSGLSIEEYVQSKSPAHVYLNIVDGDQSVDAWQHSNSHDVCALTSSDPISETQEKRHLSWVVVLLALKFPIEDALTLARAMINVSRETWAQCVEDFPSPIVEDPRLGIRSGWFSKGKLLLFPSLSKTAMGLYPVVDSADWIKTLLEMGVKTIQLRIKDLQQADLEQQIVRAIELGRQYDAQVFINDHWQLALKHGAFGVHLGQEDLDMSNLAELSEANICLGLSTHGYYELLRVATINPSYLALGHIFPTETKNLPTKPQGLVRLALYQKLVNSMPYREKVGVPTVAIGGIKSENAQAVWGCGVTSLAVVSAITKSSSLDQTVSFFKQLTGMKSAISRKEISKC